MENSHNVLTFSKINEDIKSVLRDLDERLTDFPLNQSDHTEAFLEILDKLLEAQCSINDLKKLPFISDLRDNNVIR